MQKVAIIAKNLGSSDASRIVGGYRTDVACTLLQRDYKGLSNYSSNAVVVANREVNYGKQEVQGNDQAVSR